MNTTLVIFGSINMIAKIDVGFVRPPLNNAPPYFWASQQLSGGLGSVKMATVALGVHSLELRPEPSQT